MMLGVFGFAVLCGTSVLTTWLATYFNIPVPGAILGLLLLLVFCVLRGKPGKALDRSSQRLILLIPLLILPSCVGLIEHWALIQREWLAILVAIVISVLFTLVTTPWLYAKLRVDAHESSE